MEIPSQDLSGKAIQQLLSELAIYRYDELRNHACRAQPFGAPKQKLQQNNRLIQDTSSPLQAYSYISLSQSLNFVIALKEISLRKKASQNRSTHSKTHISLTHIDTYGLTIQRTTGRQHLLTTAYYLLKQVEEKRLLN